MSSLDVSTIPLSVPAPGRTIQSLVAAWEHAVVRAYRSLVRTAYERGLVERVTETYRRAFLPVVPVGGDFLFSQDTILELASAAAVTTWMLAKHNIASDRQLPYIEAESWFMGQLTYSDLKLTTSGWVEDDVFSELEAQDYGRAFHELLPYILELFQTHNQHFTDVVLSTARERQKRLEGVFCTPSDLADYIVREVATDWQNGQPLELGNMTWLDPACGTGVFFVAVLDWARKTGCDLLALAFNSLFGIDINPHAVQSSAFVLVNYVSEAIRQKQLSPWQAWQIFRGNLAVADSTLVGGFGASNPTSCKAQLWSRAAKRESLQQSNYRASGDTLLGEEYQAARSLGGLFEQGATYRYLGDLFPECEEGCDFLVGNPPYSAKQDHRHRHTRDILFDSSALDRKGNVYTLFVEMMWRFTTRVNARAGLVVPLSIAYNTDSCFRALRSAVQKSNHRFRFTFFDRTPDSLFGDAVKTRNSVVILDKMLFPQTMVETGPIVRWSSRSRTQLFASLAHVKLDQVSITDFIPKLGSELEMSAYRALMMRHEKLGLMWKGKSFSLCEGRDFQKNSLYFYTVAYNWLSIFRAMPRDVNGTLSISNSLRGLNCKNAEEADFVFALLSSRIPYWLWRVEGDGFHLALAFLNRIPIHIDQFSARAISELQQLSHELWSNLLQNPMESYNAGKRTINYSPENSQSIVNRIDHLLIRELDLPREFAGYLNSFSRENIVVGREEDFRLRAERKKGTNGHLEERNQGEEQGHQGRVARVYEDGMAHSQHYSPTSSGGISEGDSPSSDQTVLALG